MQYGSRSFSIFFLVLFLFILVRDERTPKMTGIITVDQLRGHVQGIHFDRSPYDRYQELEQVAEYIYRNFQTNGLQVTREPFQWEGRQYCNIIAEKRGTISPEKVIILGAHYDSVPGSPGADDNASAVAVLLEVARYVSAVPRGATVKFIAFTLEEYGYVGSTHHARKVKKEGTKIEGMISLEMVGFTAPTQNYPSTIDPKYYPSVGDFIGIVGNKRSEALLNKVRASLKNHIPQLPAEFLTVPGNGEGFEELRLSDHSPFWDQGFPALLVTDTSFLRNPNYHLPTDTIETLDFEFMQKVAVGMYYSVLDLTK
jgi:Zn-dependent M28 family amino/carboxypeptidase